MKICFFLACIIVVSSGLICPNGSAYSCLDITESSKCSGVLSGRTCLWKESKCTFQTCGDLGSSCSSIVLEGKQCFKNSASQCIGADSCASYDTQETCKSFKNVQCIWDITNDERQFCRNASCADITAPDECMKTVSGSTSCYYWGNIGSCDVAICENRSENQCDGKSSNGRKCHWNSICRYMTCEDLMVKNQPVVTSDSNTPDPNAVVQDPEGCSIDKFQLSDTILCKNQLNAQQKNVCTQVSSCTDLKSKEVCEDSTLTATKCKWDITCRNQSCRDFNEQLCPQEFGDGGCTWVAQQKLCISCGEITDGCQCNEKNNCFWNYDQLRNESRCMAKKCSLLGTSSECQNQGCYWNSDTNICGNTVEDTGFTQSKITDKSEISTETAQSNIGFERLSLISIFLLWTIE